MQITEIKIRLMDEERLKAFASVTFDNCFVVHNMKVVQGDNGLLLCMPSRKTVTDQHRDLVHPITRQFRSYLETAVFKVYQEKCANPEEAPDRVSFPEGTQQVF